MTKDIYKLLFLQFLLKLKCIHGKNHTISICLHSSTHLVVHWEHISPILYNLKGLGFLFTFIHVADMKSMK